MKKGNAIVQLDKYTGKVIKKYPSVRAASLETGIDDTAIRRQLTPDQGRLRTSKASKYIWITQERYEELKWLGFMKERKA